MSERFKAIRILFKSVVGTANVIVILLRLGWDVLCFAFGTSVLLFIGCFFGNGRLCWSDYVRS